MRSIGSKIAILEQYTTLSAGGTRVATCPPLDDQESADEFVLRADGLADQRLGRCLGVTLLHAGADLRALLDVAALAVAVVLGRAAIRVLEGHDAFALGLHPDLPPDLVDVLRVEERVEVTPAGVGRRLLDEHHAPHVRLWAIHRLLGELQHQPGRVAWVALEELPIVPVDGGLFRLVDCRMARLKPAVHYRPEQVATRSGEKNADDEHEDHRRVLEIESRVFHAASPFQGLDIDWLDSIVVQLYIIQ